MSKNINVYLVQQWNEERAHYEISGIFDDIIKAFDACRDETYVVGEFELNKQLPHEPVDGTWWDNKKNLISKSII